MSRDYVKNQRSSRSAPQSSSSGPSGMVWLLVGVLMGLIIAGIFYVKNQHSTPAAEMASPSVTPSASQSAKSSSSTAATTNQSLQTQFDFYNVLPSQKIVGPSGDEDTSDINNQNNSLNNPTPPATALQSNTTQQTSSQQTTDQTSTASQNTSASVAPTTQTPAANTSTPVASNTTTTSNQTASTTATPASTTNKPAHTNSATSSTSATSTTPTTSATANEDNYILQIATFSQFTAADQLKAQLSLAGFEVNISQIQHNGKAMERVWVGPFHTQDEAETVQKQLQDNQISSKLLKSS